jgi:hypothetical protein
MKRINMILMAFAMVLTMTQCKKNEAADQNETVTITLDVKHNNGAKVDVNPTIGTVDFETGDKVYVGSGGKYVGFLTHNGTNFVGNITNPTEGQPLQFYFLGNVTPNETLSAGTSEECSVIISDQTEHLPVISCAPSFENYVSGITAYTGHLLNKCALVKFSVTTPSNSPVCITGMKNKVTVDFSENTVTPSMDGEGIIMLPAGVGENVEKWAILLPQEALEEGEEGSIYSGEGIYTGVRPEIPTITENGYWANGIDLIVSNDYRLPIVVTSDVIPYTVYSAIGGGNVIDEGGSDVISRGICWSDSPNPDTTDFVVCEGLGIGEYSCLISELNLGDTIYVRAFATNQYGTVYGDEISFSVGVGSLYEFDDGSQGIIFYMNQELHGLVVSLETGQGQWTTRNVNIGDIPNAYPAPVWLEIGLGITYTNALISQVGTSGAPAAAWCRSKGSGWYLPSLGELMELARVKTLVDIGLNEHGGSIIGYNSYWSSSEYNNQASWLIEYGSNARNYYKRSSFSVKAIRMF